VVLLGDTNSGKTSLVLRFVEGTYKDNRNATIGAFFLTKRLTLDSALCCKLLLWDTSGQEQFQRLALTYYKQAAAAIVCVDLSSNDPDHALSALQAWLEQVQSNITSHRIVLVVAGCKSDLVQSAGSSSNEGGGYGSYSAHTFALEEQIRAVADRYGAAYVRTSAKNNQGVTQAFQRTASLVLQCQQEAASGRGRPIPVTLGGAAAAATGGGGGGGGSGSGTVAVRNPSKSKHHRSLSPTINSHGHGHSHGDPKKGAAGESPPNHNHHRRALSASDPATPDYRSQSHLNGSSGSSSNPQRRHYPQHLPNHPENRHDYSTPSTSSRGRDGYDAAMMMAAGSDPAAHGRRRRGGVAGGAAAADGDCDASNEKDGYDDDDEDPLHSNPKNSGSSGSGNPNLLHHGSKIMCDNGLMLCSSGPDGTSQECKIL
jgi:small GTP-binding protein